jgi:hypothetical protein
MHLAAPPAFEDRLVQEASMTDTTEQATERRREIIERLRSALDAEGELISPQELAIQEAYVNGDISLEDLKRYHDTYYS